MKYVDLLQHQHEQFECYSIGLIVNPERPHLGASPDGGVLCSCCGLGLVEIKCTYKYRDFHSMEVEDPNFYLHTIEQFLKDGTKEKWSREGLISHKIAGTEATLSINMPFGVQHTKLQ